MKKKLSKILAIMLVLVMMLPGVVLADGEPLPAGPNRPDRPEWDGTQTTFGIRKVLEMPDGTLAPESRFYFDFELISVNGATPNCTNSECPDSNNEDYCLLLNLIPDGRYYVEFYAGYLPESMALGASCPADDGEPEDCPSYDGDPEDCPSYGGGTGEPRPVPGSSTNVYVYREVEVNLEEPGSELNDLLNGVAWPSAGIFRFRITERAFTNPDIDSHLYHHLSYDNQVYYLYVYVVNEGTGLYVPGELINPDAEYGDADYGVRHPGHIDTTLVVLGVVSQETTRRVDCDACAAANLAAAPDYDLCEDCWEEKVYSTPGESDFIFRNILVITEDPWDPIEDDPEDAPFFIEKVVTGNMGDRDRYFEFNVSVTIPALLRVYTPGYEPGALVNPGAEPGDDDYGVRYPGTVLPGVWNSVPHARPEYIEFYIIGANGAVVTADILAAAADASPAGHGINPAHIGYSGSPAVAAYPGSPTTPARPAIPATSASPNRVRVPVTAVGGLDTAAAILADTVEFDFNLSHGDRLVFVQLPVGTTYVVTEFEDDDHVQSAVRGEGVESHPIWTLVGGVFTPNSVSGVTTFVPSDDCDCEDPDERDDDCDAQDVIVPGTVRQTPPEGNEANNAVVVNNHRVAAPPMGVFLNNLPFVGLIAFAVVALAGFVVLKVRKGRQEEEVVYQ